MFGIKEIILSEIKPALGCTEPAAIALNASYLSNYIKENSKIELTINANLFKNAMYVPIPNTGKKFGVKLAFLLGLLCSESKNGLNIFQDVTDECVQKALSMLNNVTVNIKEGHEIYIHSKCGEYEVLTRKYHDAVEYVITPEGKTEFEVSDKKNNLADIESYVKSLSFDELIKLMEKETDFSFVKKSVELNMKLAETGMQNRCGLGIGKSMRDTDANIKAVAYTVAASDARMEGVNMPAMSLTGSGNHGIGAILPVWVYGLQSGYDLDKIYKSVALSMAVTIYIKLFLGRLSPVCGASLASGCGAASGITYLESEDYEKVKEAVKFVISVLNGTVCEGAKEGCSLKVMTGAHTAFRAVEFALAGKSFSNEGILDNDITKTVKNLGIVTSAMKNVDSAVINIMLNKIN